MCAIGVDFGGTWIRAACVGQDGLSGEIHYRPTVASRQAEDIVSELVDVVLSVEREAEMENLPLGLGVPTPIDAHGRLAPCPNLPSMPEYPLGQRLTERLDRQVWLTNDATCFALGEWKWGAGVGTENMLGVTLGTSIGLGIIAANRSIRGATGQAGEIWRSPVDLVSEDSPDLHTVLRGSIFSDEYYSRTGHRLESVQVAEAASNGDPVAQELFSRYGRVLGSCLAWLSNVFDPEVIVLGGSVAESFSLFQPAMERILRSSEVTVMPRELGNTAAILGAALPALSG